MTEREVSSERVSEERLERLIMTHTPHHSTYPSSVSCGDIVSMAQELLALRSSVKTVGVKKLEWIAIEAARSNEDPRSEETGDYEATTPFGVYQIEIGFGSDEYVWSLSFNGLPVEGVRDANDPEKLKSAAQADYERRILSAIEAPTTPVIRAVFHTMDGNITGTTSAPVLGVDQEDDGSFTVIIDYWPSPAAPSEVTHPDDIAVDQFAAAMKAKLAKKRDEGRGGWERKDECTAEFLSHLLREHVEKGDPLDVGNLAMMLHQRGERIAVAPSDVTDAMVDAAHAVIERSYQNESWEFGPPSLVARAALTAALKGDR